MSLSRSFRALAAVVLLATPLTAIAQPTPPKLLVTISIDQFSADLFAEYRPLYTAGLKRLEQGAVFPSGYQSHAATETCPGHSTILTGAHPSRTGIIANNWYDLSLPRADKKVYCTEDPTVPGSSSDSYTVSPQFLKVPTLGDRMKAANPQSRVVSVAGKDRAAVMMGGHAIDQAWYWGGKSFVTLPGRTAPAPAAVARVNADVAAVLARPGRAVLPAACTTRAAAVHVGTRDVGTLIARKAADVGGFRTALDFDREVTDLAVALIKDLKLGQGDAPDALSIGLSATDAVGHAYGTEGAEMCAQVLGVDANVGRILAALDASKVPYAVVLTADHGGHDLPERNAARGIADAQRVDPALSPAAVGQALAAEFKLTGPVLYGDGPFGDIYLSRDIPADIRPRVLEAARARYLAHPQVAGVFTAAELRRMPSPRPPVEEWSLAERFRASFDPERSGDLLVALKPHVTPIADPKGSVATHGSPWIYDRRVPMLFYRPGTTGFEQPLSVETVDILPTLAALIALPVPAAEIDGRCLDLDPGPVDTCAAR
ncbi:MAG TPA: alkaline phosphatase family protein [Sphingomonas sp.]|jgi:alkaline phosphatase|uniref:alkaline phosphatase family protein n=1 Tax=Sphingomonas sp. TaxID=28214 RepID=UPI002ED97EBC